jgi:hypothetical protein
MSEQQDRDPYFNKHETANVRDNVDEVEPTDETFEDDLIDRLDAEHAAGIAGNGPSTWEAQEATLLEMEFASDDDYDDDLLEDCLEGDDDDGSLMEPVKAPQLPLATVGVVRRYIIDRNEAPFVFIGRHGSLVEMYSLIPTPSSEHQNRSWKDRARAPRQYHPVAVNDDNLDDNIVAARLLSLVRG